MSTPGFDPIQYKTRQRQEWGRSAGGWQQHLDIWERAAEHVNERLVELASIQPGHTVLDIATGLGEPALTAASRVGPTGRVIAIDQAPEMLVMARERAVALGIAHVDFQEMDAEALGFPAGTFDAILCRWGLMFLPNLAAVLHSIHRLLRPGGWFAAAVWSSPSRAPAISRPLEVVRQALHVASPPPGTPTAFSLSDARVLEQMLIRAGFTEVSSACVTVTLEYASGDAFVRERQAVQASFRELLAQAPPEQQATLWRAVADVVRPYASADGTIRVPNEALCIVGQCTTPPRA